MDIARKNLVLVPINDATEHGPDAGQHWSLLVAARVKQAGHGEQFQLWHYDTAHGDRNIHLARKVSDRFFSGAQVLVGNCKKQRNGFDCGVHTLLISKTVVQEFLATGSWRTFARTGSWRYHRCTKVPRLCKFCPSPPNLPSSAHPRHYFPAPEALMHDAGTLSLIFRRLQFISSGRGFPTSTAHGCGMMVPLVKYAVRFSFRATV